MTEPSDSPRTIEWMVGGEWSGNGIAYGPFRDGQRPGGENGPTAEQLREDIRIIGRHWDCLRVYGSGPPTEGILESIREMNVGLRVVLGVWIATEEPSASDRTGASANRDEIEAAVRLAAAYPDVVMAISVGNETQVSWSGHRVPRGRLIELVREVRSRTKVPVTVADDFNYWNKPESKVLARELDVLMVHFHPLWNGYQVEEAVAATRSVWGEIRRLHPDKTLVLGEVGWATKRHSEGEQARLIKGATGEWEQMLFMGAFRDWAVGNRIPHFFFEAFDENWKGGSHPDEVEKHWGLFRSDRSPKLAMRSWTTVESAVSPSREAETPRMRRARGTR